MGERREGGDATLLGTARWGQLADSPTKGQFVPNRKDSRGGDGAYGTTMFRRPSPAPSAFASARLGPLHLRNRIIKAATSKRAPLILLGGINELATIDGAMAEGFELVAMARALLREPDLPNKLAAHESTGALCTHRNQCLPTIYTGTRCVLVES